ncbi:unnamed protein product [Schistocephalus solidus]|uniref:Uncharacterized protein n=1 Tax=Schistocephalus solidus TaxID=70667 RepID=A0A183T7E2_SCHSO|nr:unnamed protein product [Schistocephalus solidus]
MCGSSEIASRGLPHILAFLSVRGAGPSPESPSTSCSRLNFTSNISVVVPWYSGSDVDEEDEVPPDQEMKEIPERKALSTTSVKPRDPAANWWRVTAQRTFTAGSPCRSPHGKAVDLKFSRDSSTPASAPLTASRLPPKPALRSRHVSDSVAASAFPNLADDSGDDDTKWKQYADSHFSRSVPMPSFFMGDDEFTPPDFPYDQNQSGEDQESSQDLSVPVAQPRATRTAMYLPGEEFDFTSEDSDFELADRLLHQSSSSKSRLHTQSRREAEGSSRSAFYRPPPATSQRNGHGHGAAHSGAFQRVQETSEHAVSRQQSAQRRLTPQPSMQQPPVGLQSGWNASKRHQISGAGLEATGDSHRGLSVASKIYPQMLDYAELWRGTAAQLKLVRT